MTKFKPTEFGLVIADEAHGATARTWKRVLNYYKQNPDLKILGLTATPDRLDEESLGQIFDEVAVEPPYEILDAINDGWLVNVYQYYIGIDSLDYSDVKTTAGDLNGGELARILEVEETAQKMVGASVEAIGDKSALMFTESVKQAEICCDIFNRHKSGIAEWASGETPRDERRKIVKRFKEGETQVLVNCDLWGKGFDAPATQFIILGRPTKSRSRYAQWIGRGTRPLTGLVDPFDLAEDRKQAIESSDKPFLTVLDFAGNSGRHKLVSCADILGGNVSDEIIERAEKKAKESGQAVNVTESLLEAEEEIRLEREEREQRERARKAKLLARVKFQKKSIDPFDVFGITPTRERGWDRGKKLSEKQRSLLEKQGIDPDKIPYSQAKQLIGEIFNRWKDEKCSFKQAKLLQRYDYDPSVTRQEAKIIIDALAANGWKRPIEEPVTVEVDEPW